MRLIDADALYERLDELEELARDRVIDTPNSFPDGSLNPAAVRYMAQLSERTQLKEIVVDTPTVEPERKTGKWIETQDTGTPMYECSECEARMIKAYYDSAVGSEGYRFCPYCGEAMEPPKEESE